MFSLSTAVKPIDRLLNVGMSGSNWLVMITLVSVLIELLIAAQRFMLFIQVVRTDYVTPRPRVKPPRLFRDLIRHHLLNDEVRPQACPKSIACEVHGLVKYMVGETFVDPWIVRIQS